MKNRATILALIAAGAFAAYAFRDRLLAGMLGLMGRVEALEGDPTEEEDQVIRFPKHEEDLDAH